jgi:hypothetical protein
VLHPGKELVYIGAYPEILWEDEFKDDELIDLVKEISRQSNNQAV